MTVIDKLLEDMRDGTFARHVADRHRNNGGPTAFSAGPVRALAVPTKAVITRSIAAPVKKAPPVKNAARTEPGLPPVVDASARLASLRAEIGGEKSPERRKALLSEILRLRGWGAAESKFTAPAVISLRRQLRAERSHQKKSVLLARLRAARGSIWN
jgi:hypothetical protein